jgi:hypothetical protein
MVSNLTDLEVRGIEQMPRQELLEAIRTCRDHLPVDLLERLEERPIYQLQMLLLAARLIQVMRHLKGRG